LWVATYNPSPPLCAQSPLCSSHGARCAQYPPHSHAHRCYLQDVGSMADSSSGSFSG
jgi:hypothetical protein